MWQGSKMIPFVSFAQENLQQQYYLCAFTEFVGVTACWRNLDHWWKLMPPECLLVCYAVLFVPENSQITQSLHSSAFRHIVSEILKTSGIIRRHSHVAFFIGFSKTVEF